ncbi:MAG: phosphopantothenoylcysteine decarboxylase [Victivallaceae bacterium]|nr:phosphopantothenoylcysteine decarboxylase [Victivallaceae bacterium]
MKLVVLGITGGIAAYKAAEICRLLVKSDVGVQVMMTENAKRFVTTLTFATLSRRPVIDSLWTENGDWRPEHVAVADEADAFLVAPATADFIAKYASGIADDALTTFAATFSGPTVIAPAMNPAMWSHPACVANVATLKSRGVNFCGPENGDVACGASGVGRLADVDRIVKMILSVLG